MTVVFTTERLRVRLMTEADAPNLRALNANPNVYRYTGDGPLADDDAARAVLRERIFPQYRDHGVGRWAVERLADDVFLGWCGLKWIDRLGGFDLGYRFFEEHWGKGYATEAARATLAWARAHRPGVRIVGQVHPPNTASIRVLEKVGLRFVGHEDDEGVTVAMYEARDAIV